MILYQQHGLIIRYNLFKADITTKEGIREKTPGFDSVNRNHYYRNHFEWPFPQSRIGDGMPLITNIGRYTIEENLMDGAGWYIHMDSAESGRLEDFIVRHNTGPNRRIFESGIGSGPLRFSNASIYNNLSFEPVNDILMLWAQSSGQPVFPTDPVYSGWNATDQPNYNGWVVPNVGNAIVRNQYPLLDRTFAQWQGLGYDVNSTLTTVDPFVDSAGGDWRIAAGSWAETAGRVGGVSGGAQVELGCFANEYWLPYVGRSPM